jgi:glutamate racemase
MDRLPSADGSIGLFDSGVGGISLLHHVRRALPREDLLYIADSRYIPYGEKTGDFIRRRAARLADFLCSLGAKAIVVACNTATAAAVADLRSRCRLPVIGMEPGVKPAACRTRTGVVGIMATPGTLESPRFALLLQRFRARARVVVQPCKGLVEQVERCETASSYARELVLAHIEPLLAQNVDVIVLGCTHYPFLTPLIREAAGEGTLIIDTGEAVSRELVRRLEAHDLCTARREEGTETFWTSGDPEAVGRAISRLWNRPAQVRALPLAVAEAK